jgi:hypothetical protein
MHAFIIDAIRESVTRDEQRTEFAGTALLCRKSQEEIGRAVSSEEMQGHALASVRGKKPSKPVAVKRAKKVVIPGQIGCLGSGNREGT